MYEIAKLKRKSMTNEANKKERELEKMKEKESEYLRLMERLRHIGGCPNGDQWLREGSMWGCCGGTHYVSDKELLEKEFR